MDAMLKAIHERRAVRKFEAAEIPEETRRAMLEAATLAPSSFNLQPYRFYWIASAEKRAEAARYCLGQRPATTASALVVAVADVGSWRETMASQVAWMKAGGVEAKKAAEYAKKMEKVKWFFLQGWFSMFGAMKWMILRVLNLVKIMGSVPASHGQMLAWATKGTALACENLMIAAEALGWQSCPMEGFDGRRLGRMLGLKRRRQAIAMVIAIGKRAKEFEAEPRWRRKLEETVTVI